MSEEDPQRLKCLYLTLIGKYYRISTLLLESVGVLKKQCECSIFYNCQLFPNIWKKKSANNIVDLKMQMFQSPCI